MIKLGALIPGTYPGPFSALLLPASWMMENRYVTMEMSLTNETEVVGQVLPLMLKAIREVAS